MLLTRAKNSSSYTLKLWYDSTLIPITFYVCLYLYYLLILRYSFHRFIPLAKMEKKQMFDLVFVYQGSNQYSLQPDP